MQVDEKVHEGDDRGEEDEDEEEEEDEGSKITVIQIVPASTVSNAATSPTPAVMFEYSINQATPLEPRSSVAFHTFVTVAR